MALEIIGMGADIGKNDSFITEIVNKTPIIFDMTFSESAVITGKSMLPATLRQRFFLNLWLPAWRQEL